MLDVELLHVPVPLAQCTLPLLPMGAARDHVAVGMTRKIHPIQKGLHSPHSYRPDAASSLSTMQVLDARATNRPS